MGTRKVCLQIVETVSKNIVRLLMNALPDEEGELVSVLTRSRHTDGTWPIVVQMAQLVCQTLEVIRLETGAVGDDVVMGGGDGSLSYTLGD